MNIGEFIYHNIPRIQNTVNRELWIQKWTKGIPTNELVNNYVTQNKTIILEWNEDTSSYSLQMCLLLLDYLRCIDDTLTPKHLILNEHGQWKLFRICNSCLKLFTPLKHVHKQIK